MSTEKAPHIQAVEPAAPPLPIKELIALLIRHHNFHEGKFDLLIEYQFGAGAFGPTPETVNPGVMIGIAKLGLTRALKDGPLTVDAAEVNPEPARRTAKPRSSVKRGDA